MADLELSVGVGGVDQAVSDLQKVKDAQGQVATAAVASGRATQAAGAQASGALRATGQAAQSAGAPVAQLAQRLQGTSAAVASLAGQIGARGAQSGASLVASMGGLAAQGAAMGLAFGPQGALVGALVGAAGAVASLAAEHVSATRAAHDHADALSSVRQQLALMREASLQSDIASGVFGSDMTAERATAERTIRQRRMVEIAQEIAGGNTLLDRAARFSMGISQEAHDERMMQLSREAEQAREEIANLDRFVEERNNPNARRTGTLVPGAIAVPTDGRPGHTPPARHGARGISNDDAIANEWTAAVERRREYNAEMERLASAEKAREEELGRALREFTQEETERKREAHAQGIELAGAAAAAERERFQEAMRHQAELAEAARTASAAFRDGWTSSLDDVADRWREANVALRAAGQTQISTGRLMERSMVAIGNNIAETVGGTMVGAFKTAVSAWVDGSKTFVEAAEDMVKGVIQALVIESIVQGVVELARGIADIASYQYATGAQHFAAAAAWAAVGGVAGAVGGAIGAFGGGGGGAGKDAAGGTDQRGLADRSLGEGDADRSIIVIVQPGWANAREQQRFVYGSLAAGARGGMRVDSTALRGRR
jgi:hypothetical protein